VLAFVVAGASRKERSAVEARLEWRRFPQVERFGGLNVVMAVNHKVAPTARRGGRVARRLSDDDRMALRRAQARLQSDGPAVFDKPAGGGFDIGPVMALCRNAGKTEIVTQFADEAGFVFLEVGQDILHECGD